MVIVFSAENNKSRIEVPNVPIDIKIPTLGSKTSQFESIKGTLTLFGNKKLRNINWESFIKEDENPYGFIDWIEKYNNKKIPIRVSISHGERSLLNMAATVSNFESWINQTSEINYSIALTEYVFV
jgi:hypothetical protein